jgi:hypothetical protein
VNSSDRGSTIPLILGFFILALLMTAGAVSAGQAFVQQRDLQNVCDGAATAGAAAGADINRGAAIGSGGSLRFANVQPVIDGYLARDPSRSSVRITAGLSADSRTLSLRCTQTLRIAFGAMFGRAGGIQHIATSSAQAPLS